MDDALPANRYELRVRGDATTTFTSAQRAAAAFHAADAARQPSVHRFARDEPEMEIAKTSLRGPDYGMPDHLVWRKEVDAVLPEGERFREAYYAAVESSLRMRLETVENWVKAGPRLGNGMVWQVDRTLYDDLETLAFARPEKAIQAWVDHAGTRYDAPTFVDRDTGQVVTLADTASMAAARHLHEYRFGVRLEPEHSQTPAQAQAAQAAVPAQPDVQMQPRTQAQPPGKEQKVNEQSPSPPTDQQPVAAPTEQVNTVEPADGRAHAIDGTPVELIRYSRRGKGDDMVADLRGFNGKEQVIEARGVPLSELARVVGEDAAQQIAQAQKRTGTLPPDVMPSLVKLGQQTRHHDALASDQVQSPAPAASKPQVSAATASVRPGATAARASTTPPGAQPAAAPESPAPVIEDPPGVKARHQVQQLIIEAIKESLEERFVIRIGREPDTTEYRFRGEPGVLAFVDKGSKLATDRNEADVARGLVDLAQAKEWKALTLHGTEDFRRNVWREAAVRGLPTSGYTPTRADQEWVAARQAAQQRNTAERSDPKQTQQPAQAAAPAQTQPDRAAGALRTANPTPTQQGPTKEQVMNTMRSGLQELNADQASRERVLSRLSERLDALLAQGKPLPELARYDRSVASQRPAFVSRQVAQQSQVQQVAQPRAARAR